METAKEKIKYKHPHGLNALTFFEFWDRFTFSGILTILILYLTDAFHINDLQAYATWGTYLALGYITPLIGGFVADRLLGFERAIIIGSTLMIFGCLLLSLQTYAALYIGLALVLSGIGLFKGNISSLVGLLYQSNDKKCQEGFSQFFIGIMSGAILGPLFFGLLGCCINWRLSFLISGLGNILGLLFFFLIVSILFISVKAHNQSSINPSV